MPPNVFIDHAAGDILPAADWSSNFALIEASFDVIGPFVHGGGLIPTPGTGLAVNVSSGNALIDANVVKSGAWSITALANNTLNHLYLLQNGTGTSNTTGTAPAASVKLGTATTAGGVVTSVNINRDSGRQTFVRPENQVHGGPGAGNPASVNLASWAPILANAAEVFGVLPAGAVPAPAAPLTLTVTDTGTANEPAVLTLSHRTSATPGASFGSVFTMVADNAANSPVGQLFVNAGWSAATAGAESSLAEFFIRVAGVDTEVMRLNPNGNGQLRAVKDFQHAGTALGFYNTTPVAQPINTRDLRLGLIDLGLRAAGGATPLDLNGGALTAATITGDCLNAVSLAPASVDRNLIQPTADANHALVLKGHSATHNAPLQQWLRPDAVPLVAVRPSIDANGLHNDSQNAVVEIGDGGFSGGTGHFFGGGYGTYLGLNAPVGFGGTLLDVQIGGVSVFNIDNLGEFNINSGGMFVIGPPGGVGNLYYGRLGVGQTDPLLQFHSSPGFKNIYVMDYTGTENWYGLSSTTASRQIAAFTPSFADNTDATRKGRAVLNIWDTAAREALRLEASGSAPMLGFLGATAVVRQTGGAATAGGTYTSTEQGMINRIYTALQAYGLLT